MAQDFKVKAMKIITNIKEANNLLQLYIGATLQVFIYSASLKRMALKLVLPNLLEVIYIVGVGCESMNGSFNYSNANLSIINEINNEINNEIVTRIIDKSARFELVTSSGFSLAVGLESEFGDSFENFIKNRK